VEYYAQQPGSGLWVERLARTFLQSPSKNYGGGPPRGGIANADYWGAIVTGALRIDQTGNYQFQWSCDDVCVVYLNGQLVTGSGQVWTLSPGIVRFRLEYTEYTSGATFDIQWKTPWAGTFVSIPRTAVMRQVYCSGGCVHGCCTQDEQCSCDLGWTGQRCDVATPTVPVVGTIGSRWFADSAFGSMRAMRQDTAIPGLSYSWGGQPDSNVPADFWTGILSGYLVFNATGWYRFTMSADDYCGMYFDHDLIIPYAGGVLQGWGYAIANKPYHFEVMVGDASGPSNLNPVMVLGPNAYE